MQEPSLIGIKDPQILSALRAIQSNVSELSKATQVRVVQQVAVADVKARTQDIQRSTVSQYSKAQLQRDLAVGVQSILAGQGSDYVMLVDTEAASILIGHKGVNINGTTPGGGIRPGIAITANGIAMGYNSDDGVWHDAVVVEATGDAYFEGSINATSGNFTGTVTAESFIAGGAMVSGTDSSISDIYALADSASTLASSASSDAASALSALSKKVTIDATNVIQSGFYLKTDKYDEGTGIAIYNNGIVGKNGGVSKFVLGADGSASFAGSITGATGTFAGNVVAHGYIKVWGTQSTSAAYRGSYGRTPLYVPYPGANVADKWDVAVWGEVEADSSSACVGKIGVFGVSNLSNGFGVIGASSAGAGVYAYCNGAGKAFIADGSSQFLGDIDASGKTITAATFSGTASNASSLGTYSASSYVRFLEQSTPANTTTPVTWAKLDVNGSPGYVPVYL